MGFFGTDIDIDIDYYEATKHYEIIHRGKTHIKVICNKCEGTGRYEAYKLTDYGYTTSCNFCRGNGWIKLKLRSKK